EDTVEKTIPLRGNAIIRYAQESNCRAVAGPGARERPRTGQRRRAEARSGPTLHDDAGRDVQPSVADCIPPGRTDADHRKARPRLAGDANGREDAGLERPRRSRAGTGRHAWDLRVPEIRHGPERVPDVLRTG